MVTGSRLRMEHFFVVLLPELPYLFFLTTHQKWITPREGALVDDLELLSFKALGFLLLISSGRIDFISFQGDLFRRFALDFHLFVQVGKCLQLFLRDCVRELSYSWL